MTFAGDKKVGESILIPYENKLKAWLLPLVPSRVETYHLTLSTLIWCGFILIFSFMARYNIRWLWGVSLMIFFQYITDLLDGAIGRLRNTGLIKWGYYMDHFLDYVFLCTLLIGYGFLLPAHYQYMLFFILAMFGAFMVNSFLSFAAMNEFKIAYFKIGPTEIRLLFIILNTILIFTGKTSLLKSIPVVLLLSAFGLFMTVFRTQKRIWAKDMENRKT